MRDWVAIIVGICVFVLGILIYLTPETFEVYIVILPMSLVSTLVFGLALLLIVVGVISYICDKVSKG